MRFAAVIVLLLVIRYVMSQAPLPACEQCKTLENLEEIEWHRMGKGTWYDVMNMPPSGPAADCFNWVKFDINGSGFTVTFDVISARRVEVDSMKFLFTNTRRGVYKLEHAYKQESLDTVKQHVATEEEEVVEEHLKSMQQHEWFFLTDYENYFFAGYCTKDGWFMNVKSQRHVIDADDIIQMYNVLNEHGISGQMDLKKICFELNKGNGPDRKMTSLLYLFGFAYATSWITM